MKATVAIMIVIVLAWAGHARTGASQPSAGNADGARVFVGAQACVSCHLEIHETW